MRTDVDPKWMSYFYKQSSFIAQTRAELESAARRELNSYVQCGIAQSALAHPAPDVMPPFRNWERILSSDLKLYGNIKLHECELNANFLGSCDSVLLAAAFAAVYMGELIEYYAHRNFPSRFSGRKLNMMNLKMSPYTAVGVVTGAYEQAFRLAKIQISAYHSGYYFAIDNFPIFIFILRILADYLGEGDLPLVGEAAKEPIFGELFDHWRQPKENAIMDLCLAACDFHTRRCAPGKRDQFHEFDSGAFMLTPVEILLLFKLRSLVGLSNPVLDHPLMNGPMGELSSEVGFRPDDLTANVLLRMRHDGFDEAEISSL